MLETKTSRCCAFTLVEILVVVAIIALLSMILLPVINNARERGRVAVCSSNLRQIGMAFQTYMQDSDSRFPEMSRKHWLHFALPAPEECGERPFGGEVMAAQRMSWAFQLKPYAPSNGIFVCPSVAAHGQAGGPGGGRGSAWNNCEQEQHIPLTEPQCPPVADPFWEDVPSDYAINTMVAAPEAWKHSNIKRPGSGITRDSIVASWQCQKPFDETEGERKVLMIIKMSSVAAPSTTILLADAGVPDGLGGQSGGLGGAFSNDTDLDYSELEPYLATGRKLATRHNNGYNALFMDGHVRHFAYGSSRPEQWTIQND